MLSPADREVYVRAIIADRVPDLRFLLDVMLTRAPGELSEAVDESRVGLIGWSFGGWAALATLEQDARFRGVLALAPAGNFESAARDHPGDTRSRGSARYRRCSSPRGVIVSRRFPGCTSSSRGHPRAGACSSFAADHSHFTDQVEDQTLCTREHAHLFTRTLGLADMDAVLNDDERAERILSRDPARALRARGIDTVEHPERIAD